MRELLKSGVSLGLRAVTAPSRLVGRMMGRNGAPPREPGGRVLLVCGHWIGDTLWASQVVADLNSSFPAMELHVACKAHGAVFFRDRPGSEFVHLCPELISDRTRETVDMAALDACAARLKALGFEGVIDLTGNRYSARLTSRIGARWTLGFDGDELGFLYGKRVRNAERPGAHHSERPFRVIEALTGKTVTGLDLRVDGKDDAVSETLVLHRAFGDLKRFRRAGLPPVDMASGGGHLPRRQRPRHWRVQL